MLHLTPAVPAPPIERKRLRPRAHRARKTRLIFENLDSAAIAAAGF
jgi:hypothetical protein